MKSVKINKRLNFSVNATAIPELVTILQAMAQLSHDLNGCVQFRFYDQQRDAGRDHLVIAKTMNDG